MGQPFQVRFVPVRTLHGLVELLSISISFSSLLPSVVLGVILRVLDHPCRFTRTEQVQWAATSQRTAWVKEISHHPPLIATPEDSQDGFDAGQDFTFLKLPRREPNSLFLRPGHQPMAMPLFQDGRFGES
jgi:hypothetical protein